MVRDEMARYLFGVVDTSSLAQSMKSAGEGIR